MTRVWSNGTNQQENKENRNGNNSWSETNLDDKNTRISSLHEKVNGNQDYNKNHQLIDDVEKDEEEEEDEEKKSFFRLCCSETLEKDLAEQSKVVLNMIYFFQVLPFYILQFTSGMALGEF